MLTPEEIERAVRREELSRAKAKAKEALGALVLARVLNGVWHTTNAARFQGIVASGAILAEPSIADGDRWGASRGKDYYPYVRTLGGVSLFDFAGFEPEEYSKAFPMSSWWEFVPYRSVWNEAVWIEIDADALGGSFISGRALLERWNAGEVGNRIMPQIEAAHLGPIPLSSFKSVFVVREGLAALLPINW